LGQQRIRTKEFGEQAEKSGVMNQIIN